MPFNYSLTVFLICVFLCSTVVVDSFKFLAVLYASPKSHFIFCEALLKALAEKGHEVYVVSPFSQETPVENYHDVTIALPHDESVNLFDKTAGISLTASLKLFDTTMDTTHYILEQKRVQQLLTSNHKFDAVICELFDSDLLFGLSEHFNAPLIGLSTAGATSVDTWTVGSPSPPSYVPAFFLRFSDRMLFFQRAKNLAVVIFEKLLTDFQYLPRQAVLYKKNFPNSKRDIYDVRKNTALVLVNSHISYVYPRPYMPNHVEVGGMHIKSERTPLPWDIQIFIEQATHGVVYFYMGTCSKSGTSLLSDDKRDVFLQAFREIKQRVLWKLEDHLLMGATSNILVSHWFPQNDILAHENVKIFITHGGLLSTIESIYHGTPIIGIPVLNHQYRNVAKAAADGFAVGLDYDKLTAQDLVTAINLLINNETYTQRAKNVSAQFRDQPMSPRDLAVFWVEHVAQHKGAKYLHCAGLDLNFIQYHNIDAIIILVVFLFIILHLLKRFYREVLKPVIMYLWRNRRELGTVFD